jgi:hypothetical protein
MHCSLTLKISLKLNIERLKSLKMVIISERLLSLSIDLGIARHCAGLIAILLFLAEKTLRDLWEPLKEGNSMRESRYLLIL